MLVEVETAYVTPGYCAHASYYERIVHTLLRINPPPCEHSLGWIAKLVYCVAESLLPGREYTEHYRRPGEDFLRNRTRRVLYRDSYIEYDPLWCPFSPPVDPALERSNSFVLRYNIRVGGSLLMLQLEMVIADSP